MDKNIILVFKGKQMLDIADDPGSIHAISQKALVTYPTARRLINKPEEIQAMNLSTFGRFLVYGLGLSIEQLRGMKFGDIFEMWEVEE